MSTFSHIFLTICSIFIYFKFRKLYITNKNKFFAKFISKTVAMYCLPDKRGITGLSPHILVTLVCTGLLIVLSSRQELI